MTIVERPDGPVSPVEAGPLVPVQRPGTRLLTRWTRAARTARRDAWIDDTLDRRQVVDIRYRWHAALERLGTGMWSTTPLGGQGQHALLPRVERVTLGSPTQVVLRMPPGLALDEVRAVAPVLAEALDVHTVRLMPLGHGRAVATMLARDPLAEVVPLVPSPLGVMFGRDEFGEDVLTPAHRLTHMIVQGSTRSGKSAWSYALLAQVAGSPLVDVCGLDPTGLLLRPFGEHPRGWRVTGTADPARYAVALRGLVDDMDARIASLPMDRDQVALSAACPLRLIVLEEWAGVLRLIAGDKALAAEVRGLVARLLAEGAKAGMRVLTIVQRAEAAVVGGFERAQALTRLSFAVDDETSLRMLHPTATAEQGAEHATSAPGVALLTAPGIRLLRLRGPWMGDYAAYTRRVHDAIAPDDRP